MFEKDNPSIPVSDTSEEMIDRPLKKQKILIPRKLLLNTAKPVTDKAIAIAKTSLGKKKSSSIDKLSRANNLAFFKTPIETKKEFSTQIKQEISYSDDLHVIGKIANFISQLPQNNDLHIYARCYGLLLIGEIAEKVPRFFGNGNTNLVGKVHGFNDLLALLTHTVRLRNLVADHFIRIYQDLSKIYLCDAVPKGLACLATEDEVSLTNPLPYLESININYAKAANKTIKYIDRLAYIISALQKIKEFNDADPDIKNDASMFAIAMLYVIAGTCARDLIQMKSTNTVPKPLADYLLILKFTREEFAHYTITGKNTDIFKQQVIKNSKSLDKFIKLISAEIANTEILFKQKYEAQELKISSSFLPTSNISIASFDYIPMEKNSTCKAIAVKC